MEALWVSVPVARGHEQRAASARAAGLALPRTATGGDPRDGSRYDSL